MVTYDERGSRDTSFNISTNPELGDSFIIIYWKIEPTVLSMPPSTEIVVDWLAAVIWNDP
jgi:hypothetical protein